MRHLVVALALAVLGCKGDEKKCEQAARNFAELVYKDKMEKELAAMPEDKREAARRERLGAYANAVEKDIDFFVRQCVAANNDDQVDCMIKAKTAKAALGCADLIEPD